MKKGSLVVETILIIIGIALTLMAMLMPVQGGNAPQNQPSIQGEMPNQAETPNQENIQAPPQDGQNQPGAPEQGNMGMAQNGQVKSLWGMAIISLIIYLLIAYYAFAGYKVPHGNILRYLMFAFGIGLISKITSESSASVTYAIALASALITYISGRLNKIQINKILMLIVTILIVYYVLTEAMTLITSGGASEITRIMGPINLLVQWIVIMNTYIGRFKEHAEAGLIDAPKKQKE